MLKTSNVSGAYLDAINHYLNVPVFFLCMGIGMYHSTENVLFVYLGAISTLSCRSTAKYCLAFSVLLTIKRQRSNENDPLYLPTNKTRSTGSAGSFAMIRQLVIYPNIAAIFALVTLVDWALSLATPLDRMTILSSIFIVYVVAYQVLDLGQMAMAYRGREAETMYQELTNLTDSQNQSR